VSLVIVYFSVILSYVVVIYRNAKNYNNGLNINMDNFLSYFSLMCLQDLLEGSTLDWLTY
jgi:hypothetical protein